MKSTDTMGACKLHGTIARALIVVYSIWTSVLQLASPSSIAYRAAGDSVIVDAINFLVLACAALAASDILWNDVLRRGLVLPRIRPRLRHRVCVTTYMVLAGAFGVRAFVASGDPRAALQVGVLYVLVALCVAGEAYAIAKEKRRPPCPAE